MIELFYYTTDEHENIHKMTDIKDYEIDSFIDKIKNGEIKELHFSSLMLVYMIRANIALGVLSHKDILLMIDGNYNEINERGRFVNQVMSDLFDKSLNILMSV